MCGIFGVLAGEQATLSVAEFVAFYESLFQLSETRGKEAAGLVLSTPDSILTYKSPKPASAMLNSEGYRRIRFTRFSEAGFKTPIGLLGHSRLVTNGLQQNHENNQPVSRRGIATVHNGIVVNVEEIWQRLADQPRQAEVDTEVLPYLVRERLDSGDSHPEAMVGALQQVRGMASFATLATDLPTLGLITNNGSLYYLHDSSRALFVFASERVILERLLRKHAIFSVDERAIRQAQVGEPLTVELKTAIPTLGIASMPAIDAVASRQLLEAHDDVAISTEPMVVSPSLDTGDWDAAYEQNRERVDALRRCTRCILPETIPFIEFNTEGVCNFCTGYQPIELKGHEQLAQLVEPYRRTDGRPDCLVAFSGGRDSSYGLHYLKETLGLNVLAYTYDWGMVTDLARRNQARMCGQLGVEHILVSANIKAKRENIRRNVSAWLRRPVLGTVPLFMAGDKQFFYHAHRIGKENKTELLFFSENLLEKTHFKSGFCGLSPAFGRQNTYTLGLTEKVRLGSFYGREFLLNPAYLNRSLLDTSLAFASYYILPHNIAWLFQYIPWVEEDVESTLLEGYDWETAPDTRSTWRIGDGTASFYNYIYYTMAGFSENDTFRSNQIREGELTREMALEKTREENAPRWRTFVEYCHTIGIDANHAVRTINAAPKIY